MGTGAPGRDRAAYLREHPDEQARAPIDGPDSFRLDRLNLVSPVLVRLPALARDVDGSTPFNFDPDSSASDLRLGIVSNDDTLTTRLAVGHEVPLTGHHTPRASNLLRLLRLLIRER